MNKEAQRIAIAEACGWKLHSELDATWCAPHQSDCPLVADLFPLPDYLSDLNAMHEADKVLTDEQQQIYVEYLVDGTAVDRQWLAANSRENVWEQRKRELYKVALATAAQRAEAFLRTLSLWTE